MNDTALGISLSSAAGIGFLHTIIGVDHTLPFVLMGKAERWSLRRTLALTFICGLAHVASSVVLGATGVGIGSAIARFEHLDNLRGSIAAWLLIILGLSYSGYALARRRRIHRHAHVHSGGLLHAHTHGHAPHEHGRVAGLTAWGLFLIFVLGPCEPLVPLLMVPALADGWRNVALVVATFASTTIATMMGVVAMGYYGVSRPIFRRLEPHARPLAGVAVALSGAAMLLLGM